MGADLISIAEIWAMPYQIWAVDYFLLFCQNSVNNLLYSYVLAMVELKNYPNKNVSVTQSRLKFASRVLLLRIIQTIPNVDSAKFPTLWLAKLSFLTPAFGNKNVSHIARVWLVLNLLCAKTGNRATPKIIKKNSTKNLTNLAINFQHASSRLTVQMFILKSLTKRSHWLLGSALVNISATISEIGSGFKLTSFLRILSVKDWFFMSVCLRRALRNAFFHLQYNPSYPLQLQYWKCGWA